MASTSEHNGRLTTGPNPDYLPAFRDIPGGHDSHVGTAYTKKWCLLGEITMSNTFTRPQLFVVDRTGQSCLVALYLPDNFGPAAARILSRFRRGYTVALMCPRRHYLTDLASHGVRVEDEQAITIFPCKLHEFTTLIHDAVVHNWFTGKMPTCHGCGKNKATMGLCNGCQVASYCSKECQTTGRAAKDHEKQCKVLQDPDVELMLQLDWSDHKTGFGFGPKASKGRELTPAEKEALARYNA